VSRIARLVDGIAYRSIDDVPSYDWKTPLQRAIQLLKRHRDVVYRDDPDFAPISMIITVLAARAYGGQTSLWAAVRTIVDRMPQLVGHSKPMIPNPVNPGEDFADRWAGDPRYERELRRWMSQVRADVEQLPESLKRGDFALKARGLFRVDLTAEQTRRIQGLLDRHRPASVSSLLSPAVAPQVPSFPDRPVIPRKPGGFA
jgi:hypothetical protein